MAMMGALKGKKIPTKNNRSSNKGRLSLSVVILYALVALIFFYIVAMCLIAKHANKFDNKSKSNNNLPSPLVGFQSYNYDKNKNKNKLDANNDKNPSSKENKASIDRVLTAYLEPIVDEKKWSRKPLPVRDAKADDLIRTAFPKVNSCSRLIEQFPADNFPDADPFLPWIHDVFPTHDGKFIQIVAQNKRRCKTGRSNKEKEIYQHMAPQISLFQHVSVKRIHQVGDEDSSSTSSTRYRLASHDDADQDGMATRFICRFSNGEETLSVFNFSYEWASHRKRQKVMFHKNETDNKQIHTSQLLFRCPVPASLVETVRTGTSVVEDWATIFLDIVPIRTPTRYGAPDEYLTPYYKEFQASTGAFDPAVEWGKNHTLPLIENSGRWQNIPICKPSLLTYGNKIDEAAVLALAELAEKAPVKQNRLVSCLWASAGYSTRGNRHSINDGQRRLLEWITYNKLTGVEHFYLYDNTAAFTTDTSLQFAADMFPNDVTIVKWPSKVCNNNPNNVDSPGERSSQYAAEASCRLRFGPHTEWIAQFDIDEYLVPMEKLTSLHPLLDKLDKEGTKIISFGSWRAWPRKDFIEDPNLSRLNGSKNCGRQTDCFQLRVPENYTMLQAYNCDRQKPGEKSEKMPAEKQIYRPDYVLHHFIHYSTVTVMSELNRQDIEKLGRKWDSRSPFPDPLSRFGHEAKEALMLHTKAVATQDTIYWEEACLASYTGKSFCRLGTPFPKDLTGVNISDGKDGLKFNCYVNHKIDDYWVKELENGLKDHVPEIAKRLELQ